MGIRRPLISIALLVMLCLIGSCAKSPPPTAPSPAVEQPTPVNDLASIEEEPLGTSRPYKLVRVIVALADNQHQGIVRVPADLGNGQNTNTNLYWGAMYGVRTFLPRTGHWQITQRSQVFGMPGILERVTFESTQGPAVTIIADAYDGRAMKQAIEHFLALAAGHTDHESGPADLVWFVGHNGLMDMTVDLPEASPARRPQGAGVLACRSSQHFTPLLDQLNCPPLVMTEGLMAPEAYTLDAVIRVWAAGGDNAAMREAAATAYAEYQRCSITAARRLFGIIP